LALGVQSIHTMVNGTHGNSKHTHEYATEATLAEKDEAYRFETLFSFRPGRICRFQNRAVALERNVNSSIVRVID